MENIEALLKKVGDIVKRYEDEDQKTGRRFNVYSIAGIERDEVKTHSAMIAELLNPKGSHGQGDLFLKLFLERFFEKSEIENTNKAQVYVETSYGNNGRVDIEIILNDHYIIIENKVDAGDQPEQLKRYSDIAENVKKYAKDKYSLLYLTKYGREPSEESLKSNTSNDSIKKVPNGTSEDLVTWEKGNECIDLRLISYREDIRNWLEECIKQSVFIPNIRDGLTQYLNIVKKITGDTMFATEKQKLVDLLKSEKQYLYDALAINQAFTSSELRGRILFDFFEILKKNLLSIEDTIFFEIISLPDNLEKLNINLERCQKWFERGNKEKKQWENVGFFLQINSVFLLHVEVATDALHYGLIVTDNDSEKIKKLKVAIKQYKQWDYRDWSRLKWFSNIYQDNINEFQGDIIDLLSNKDDNIANFAMKINEDIKAIVESLN